MKNLRFIFALAATLIVLVIVVHHTTHGQATSQATTGLPAPHLVGTGLPGATYACNSSFVNIGYLQQTAPTVFWICSFDGVSTYTWTQVGIIGPQFYTSAGITNNVKCWTGSITTSGGTGTVNYSSAAFTSVPNIQLQSVSSSNTASSYSGAAVSGATTTGANISVVSATTISILGSLSLALASGSNTVSVLACGT